MSGSAIIATGAVIIGVVGIALSGEPDSVVIIGHHYLIEDGTLLGVNLRHGDRLDIIVNESGAVERCNWLGGTLMPADQHRAPTGRPVCIDVDVDDL